MQTKTVSFQGSSIYYTISGTGPTVVLLHGFGEDGDVWKHQVRFLRTHFKVLVPDIPGSGKSAFIPGADIETYAEIIKLIVDIENANNNRNTGITLIGHSMGGYVSLAFAEKHPQYLNRLGLFHSTAFADNEEKKQARQRSIKFIRSQGSHEFLKTSIPGLFAKNFANKYPEKIAVLVEAAKEFTKPALIQYYEAMINRPDRTSVLQNFTKPILFIAGEHDLAVPLQSSLQQCHLPLRSYVTILHRSGHMGMWEEKQKANNAISKFLVNNF
jgi:pimeloyl-ACP methyl ester carboxylesterase